MQEAHKRRLRRDTRSAVNNESSTEWGTEPTTRAVDTQSGEPLEDTRQMESKRNSTYTELSQAAKEEMVTQKNESPGHALAVRHGQRRQETDSTRTDKTEGRESKGRKRDA
ncbi:hypothetical protein TRVL_02645 [Trypanosoma vivax]|nr:hypothetical protein TRVL_02645 [Trypanosoma vivax]